MDCGWCVELSVVQSNQYHRCQETFLMPLVFQMRSKIINGYNNWKQLDVYFLKLPCDMATSELY